MTTIDSIFSDLTTLPVAEPPAILIPPSALRYRRLSIEPSLDGAAWYAVYAADDGERVATIRRAWASRGLPRRWYLERHDTDGKFHSLICDTLTRAKAEAIRCPIVAAKILR